MLIDCDRCVMQHTSACDDCVVSVLLAGLDAGDTPAPSRGRVELDDGEAEALRNLADAGLVSPLRLVVRDERSAGGEGGETATG
jgi:hypothetical protein